jgi:hypothetical protein
MTTTTLTIGRNNIDPDPITLISSVRAKQRQTGIRRDEGNQIDSLSKDLTVQIKEGDIKSIETAPFQ